VKQALLDSRFREQLPAELSQEVHQFLANPGCNCHHDLYKKVLKLATPQLIQYYPLKDKPDPEEANRKLTKNEWTVINCNIHELEGRLKSLPPGRKQLDVSRYQDQVTVVINELDPIF
jgi:hypothetical protein